MGISIALQRKILAVGLVVIASGCNQPSETIQETRDVSFDDIAAQLATEEAASRAKSTE